MPIILRQNEQLIKIARKHLLLFAPSLTVWLLLLVAVLAARLIFSFNFFGYWLWIFVFTFLLAAIMVFYKYFLWRSNTLIITNQRVVENEQGGIFAKTVTELLYNDIVETSYDKIGAGAALYNYGNIKIRTAAENEMTFVGIADPEGVVESINKAKLNFKTVNV